MNTNRRTFIPLTSRKFWTPQTSRLAAVGFIPYAVRLPQRSSPTT
jgi:hypothetical protein